MYNTIGDLVKWAADKHPNRNAVIFREENEKLTFREFDDITNKWAAGLLSIGFKKGDKLAIWGPNTLDWYISFLGAAKIGVISVCVNPVYQLPELEYALKKSQVSGIITIESYKKQNYFQILKQLCPEINNSNADQLHCANVKNLQKIIVSTENNLPGIYRWKDILELGNTYNKELLEESKRKIKPSDELCMQFTSGTTGSPKVALFSHFNYVNNSFYAAQRFQFFDEQHIICVQTPFFHAYATVVGMLPALHTCSTLVVPAKIYTPLKTLEAIEKEKCTFVNGTPTMYIDLVNLQKEHKLNLNSLKVALSAAAPCSPILFHDMKSVLKAKVVKSAYGMTESSAVLFQSLPEESEHYATETVGHLQDHLEAKVVDENGDLVPFGTPGELHVRGYNIMLEYFDDIEKTQETKTKDGWLCTGDQFVLHENGYGQIVGRLKDMIIRGGENIFPKEIEDFLNTHPNIIESQVFGINDERLGEEVAVGLRIVPGSSFSYNDLNEFCSNNIAKYKIPKYIAIVNEFPQTASGKVQKFKLKEFYENNHDKFL
ncbi:medium-chain acyl-CoA ligase ACSF2, mitochondrial-like isoform X2 [Chrysoperla carnea]|nr:medium-chain acyl-CoA ligase ACSF2, mitochondrial-like isoform X2 [Chrysoperla carnea]